jgi:hypothetical protein
MHDLRAGVGAGGTSMSNAVTERKPRGSVREHRLPEHQGTGWRAGTLRSLPHGATPLGRRGWIPGLPRRVSVAPQPGSALDLRPAAA